MHFCSRSYLHLDAKQNIYSLENEPSHLGDGLTVPEHAHCLPALSSLGTTMRDSRNYKMSQ